MIDLKSFSMLNLTNKIWLAPDIYIYIRRNIIIMRNIIILFSFLLLNVFSLGVNSQVGDDQITSENGQFYYQLEACGFNAFLSCCCGDGQQYVVQAPTYRIICKFGSVWPCNDSSLGDCEPLASDCLFMCPSGSLCA